MAAECQSSAQAYFFRIPVFSYTTWEERATQQISDGEFRVKYQESSIGLENLAHLQSTENKCNINHTKSSAQFIYVKF